jgi:hypothetical protein
LAGELVVNRDTAAMALVITGIVLTALLWMIAAGVVLALVV